MSKRKAVEEPVPLGATRVLLHTCCAPCSSAIVEWMMGHGIMPTIYYCNPNIHPLDEYVKRRDECVRYATALGLDVVDAGYDHAGWLRAVAGLEDEPERGRRCSACFLMRLSAAARFARANGFEVIATTLASSRWKSIEQVNSAGLQAAALCPGVTFWARNWRKGGLSERRAAIIRQYNFYNQRYCGCEFSLLAAEASRRRDGTPAAAKNTDRRPDIDG